MKKSIISAVIAVSVMLCGCGKKAAELPSDNPYNHGENAIMETENGFYTNTGNYEGGHMLRFYERDTENQIFLCAKPECLHDGGEGCTATYKNLSCINTLLYDGEIYTLAIEDGDVISYSLYKAALDGTSFTKVGDAFSVSNSAGESYDVMGGIYFMIHKGYAYIPYHLTLGKGTYGFAGSGLVKMDIKTGKTEQLFSGENYFSAYPTEIRGVGDYVYFFASTSVNSDTNRGTYRYDIKTGETKKLADYPMSETAIGENKYYSYCVYEDGTYGISAHDINAESLSEGWEVLGGKLNVDDEIHRTESGLFSFVPRLMLYEDRIIVISNGDGISDGDGPVLILNENRDSSVFIMNENGEELGTFSFDMNEISGWSGELINSFKVTNGRIYAVVHQYAGAYDDYFNKVFSVSIADIEAGKGEWKFEYGVKTAWQLAQEMGGE